ncbi:MAG TPA: leucyl/phenylalanyl-tRNA--protein transferase [Myxococcales bacterium]|nr:leucyl/phenylalanyl-tRNA--protein transferase [Myxococcales bacterium]HIN85949.1 leucyl/phenylalanyl-tRNA--protein transferase [Myxococcales bacterium]
MSQDPPMTRVPFFEGDEFEFPVADQATAEGVIAMGGEITVRSLRRAYGLGFFPWPVDPRYPILWFSPPERCIFELDAVKISRSLRRELRGARFEVRFDTAFDQVLEACASARKDGFGTWIDDRMKPGYLALHKDGRRDCLSAHSIEAWAGGRLVGGLYGIAVGGVFTGESMFFRETNASKVALVALIERMRERGFDHLDAQIHNQHLDSLGASVIPREEFQARLTAARYNDCRLTD